jgi:hypothetical protein
LSSRSRSNVNVFNFGVNGATAQVVDLILRRLLAQKSLPRLILWADGARAFNSGRIDQTYDKIIASPGYKQLLAGIRPIAPQAAEPSSFCVNTSFLYPVVNPAPSQSPSFYSFIAPPTDVKQLCIQPFNRSSQPTSVIKIEPQPSQAINDPAALGFNALATRFNPTSYFRWYPRVSGAFDADYRDFTLQGRQTAALRNVVSFARSHQIPVVFVNLPLTQIYLDEARTEYEQQFRAYMQQFANSGKLTFYDFSQRWLDKYGYFADPSHLNRYGAAAVSAQLGKDLKLLKPVSP